MRRLMEPRMRGGDAAWRRRTADRPVHVQTFRSQGPSGEVHFLLQREIGGLYVEREEFPVRGMHSIQHVCFFDGDQFLRWCSHDPIRWSDPPLYAQVQAAGQRILCTPLRVGER